MNHVVSSDASTNPSLSAGHIVVVFGTRETGTETRTIPRPVACVSTTLADFIEMQDETDLCDSPLFLPGVLPCAVDPILEYMQHVVDSTKKGIDILPIDLSLEAPRRDMTTVDRETAIQHWDREFLRRWYDCRIMTAIVAGANFMAIERLVTLSLMGIAYLMLDRKDDIQTAIHTDFEGFPDDIPEDIKEEYRPHLSTFLRYARPCFELDY